MLVKVGAVSVNPIDTYLPSGAIGMGVPKPYIVGCDLAGTVEAAGPGVEDFKPGDRVWGSNQGLAGRQGTFAEYAAVDTHWLYPTPKGVSDRDAAATALVAITAHLGLVREAKVQPGEIVFVHGGSGGVGSCVIQIAKALGARVVATAGSEEKAGACRQLGADCVIQYQSQDVSAALAEFAPQGVDVWFETLREQNLDQAVNHLRMRGRLVLMAGRDARRRCRSGRFTSRTANSSASPCSMPRPTSSDGRHASIGGCKRTSSEPGSARDEARRGGKRPQAPGREHAADGRHAGRQDRPSSRSRRCRRQGM